VTAEELLVAARRLVERPDAVTMPSVNPSPRCDLGNPQVVLPSQQRDPPLPWRHVCAGLTRR
jgi:hypothetical protein